MNNNNFLPEGYEKPSTKKQYLKLEEGDNKIRILTPALVGWIDWKDRKPYRTKDEPETSFDSERPAKEFFAFAVWDYKEERVKVLDITQISIKDTLVDLSLDENWGDPTTYDINIKRKGKDMGDTKYTVVTTPPKEASAQIKDAIKHMSVDLNKLFEGGDPFSTDKTAPTPVADDSNPELAKSLDEEYAKTATPDEPQNIQPF